MCLQVINFHFYLKENDRVSRGTILESNKSFFPDEFLIKLKHYLSHDLSGVPNFCRVSLLAINNYNLRNEAVFLQDNPDDIKILYTFNDITWI